MKKYLIFLLMLPLFTFAQPKVSYKIFHNNQLQKEGLKVAIEMKYDKPTDSSYFHYSNEIWGENNLIQCITNLQSDNQAYRFKVVPDSNRIIVYHPTSKSLSFSYHIKQNFEGEKMNSFSHPRVQDNYFHLLGQSLFLVPETVFATSYEDPNMNLSIEWVGFPHHFRLHNNFGSNEKKQQLKVKVWRQLFQSLFVGGDYRIHRIPYDNKYIHFAIRGKWKVYDDITLITELKKAVSSQRDFWKDNDFPYYTIILTPTVTIEDSTYKGYSMKGTGIYQGFMLQSSNSAHNVWDEIKYMFNHEMMHEWIGTKIRTKNEELNYWFSEGFTDYYAYKNRLRNGDLTIDQWAYMFNKHIIQAHYKNPEKNKPNYSIKDNYWKDLNYQKLPYRKGALFAFWLDNQILKRSDYSRSLDNLMREILAKSKLQNTRFTDEWFLELAKPYLKEDITYFFQKHIISNVDFEFNANDLIEALRMEYIGNVPVIQVIGECNRVTNTYLNRK